MLLLLLEAAAALALVEYVRRELPALGAGAANAARRATRHRDTCELVAIVTETQHRLPSSCWPSSSIRPSVQLLVQRRSGSSRRRSRLFRTRKCHFHAQSPSGAGSLSSVDVEISFSAINARPAPDGSPLTGSRTPRSLTSIAPGIFREIHRQLFGDDGSVDSRSVSRSISRGTCLEKSSFEKTRRGKPLL